jgi:hypothetical protein
LAGVEEVNAFPTHRAVVEQVAATQNQALAVLLFLHEEVPGVPLARLEGVVRAWRAEEAASGPVAGGGGGGVGAGNGRPGSGRRSPLAPLAVAHHPRCGRGPRRSPAPTAPPPPDTPSRRVHLRAVRRQHLADLAIGLGRAPLPEALATDDRVDRGDPAGYGARCSRASKGVGVAVRLIKPDRVFCGAS